MNTKDKESTNFYKESDWWYDQSKSYQVSSSGKTMDALQDTASSIENNIYAYEDIYAINNILYQSATSPQQMREDTLSMFRQRTIHTLNRQRRQSEINIRKSNQDKYNVSRKRHHSIATRDIRMNDVLHSSEIYANPLSPIYKISKSEKIDQSNPPSCYMDLYYITMHMIGLGFGVVLGLGLLGLGSWLGLGLALSAALSALLVLIVAQLHKNKENKRQHNRKQHNDVEPIHSPEPYRNDTCHEGCEYSNLDLHIPGIHGSHVSSDIYMNGVQDTANSSSYGYDGTLNKIFDRRVLTPQLVSEVQANRFLRPSPIQASTPCTNENIYAKMAENKKNKPVPEMKYTLNISEESISLCILNPTINPVASGVNVIDEGLQITYGRYKLTVTEI